MRLQNKTLLYRNKNTSADLKRLQQKSIEKNQTEA